MEIPMRSRHSSAPGNFSLRRRFAPKPVVSNPLRQNKPAESEPKDAVVQPVLSREPKAPPSIAPPTSPPSVERLSLDALNGAQAAALSGLPAPAAAALREVWNVIDGRASSQKAVLNLLETGTLGQSNENGSVIEQIEELSRHRHPSVDPSALTGQTVEFLAAPENNSYQGNRETCAATNLQYQLASEPLKILPVVDGLTAPQGRAEVSEGKLLHLVNGSLQDDGSGRNLLNRVLQGAFMDRAGSPVFGAYDGATDRFASGDYALKPLQLADLTSEFAGTEHGVVYHDSHSAPALRKLIAEAPADFHFQMGLNWEGANGVERPHMLLFKGSDGKDITYFDPSFEGGKIRSADQATFLYKTQFALLPKTVIESMELPDRAQVYWPSDEAWNTD